MKNKETAEKYFNAMVGGNFAEMNKLKTPYCVYWLSGEKSWPFGGYQSHTPGGVPVVMRSPGSSVITLEMKATSCATEKIMSSVVESCLETPLWRVRMRSARGSKSVARKGPTGQKVSNPLARVY